MKAGTNMGTTVALTKEEQGKREAIEKLEILKGAAMTNRRYGTVGGN